mmetsp:Transcript_5753/g.10073  ORF Transcript_5753/g.10073 Transcript_5753/m.10073 type:complete len:94 (-) Transcript_5753:483-764(-)
MTCEEAAQVGRGSSPAAGITETHDESAIRDNSWFESGPSGWEPQPMRLKQPQKIKPCHLWIYTFGPAGVWLPADPEFEDRCSIKAFLPSLKMD